MDKISAVPALSAIAWQERVVAAVERDEAGCWNWTQKLMPNGYGRISVNNERHYVHRVAYATIKGPIPEGYEVDHLCRNRACCNPSHLEAVTHRVNTLRGENFAGHKYRQTHCIHGHEFDVLNTYLAPNGTRKCRICRARVRQASDARRKAAA